MAAAMDVDPTSEDYGEGPSASSDKGKKRFEVKKVSFTSFRVHFCCPSAILVCVTQQSQA